MQEAFVKAADEARSQLMDKMKKEELLQLYALYKQAVIGDCDTERPFLLGEKWDAWQKLKGVTKDAAQKAYVEYVEQLKNLHKI